LPIKRYISWPADPYNYRLKVSATYMQDSSDGNGLRNEWPTANWSDKRFWESPPLRTLPTHGGNKKIPTHNPSRGNVGGAVGDAEKSCARAGGGLETLPKLHQVCCFLFLQPHSVTGWETNRLRVSMAGSVRFVLNVWGTRFGLVWPATRANPEDREIYSADKMIRTGRCVHVHT